MIQALKPLGQSEAIDLKAPPLSNFFNQIGYVVDDLEQATESLGPSLGVTFTRAEGSSDGVVMSRGKRADLSVELAFAQFGAVEIEIIQPVSADNIYTEHLARRGAGLHHLGFKIPDGDDFRAHYEHLVKIGYSPVLEGKVYGSYNLEFCYFDCSAFGASFIEICHFFPSEPA